MIKWILLSFGTMFFVISVGLAIIITLNPPEQEAVDSLAADSVAADTVLTPLEEMTIRLAELEEQLGTQSRRADSLQQLVGQMETSKKARTEEMEQMKSTIAELEKSNADVKDLAKTFQNMKVEELRNILQQVDDDAAYKIYANMSNRSRKKLLLGLSGTRAAKLTERITN